MFSSAGVKASATWQEEGSPQPLAPSLSFASPEISESPWWHGRTAPPSRISPAFHDDNSEQKSSKGFPILSCHLPQALRTAQEEALKKMETEDLEEMNGGLHPPTGLAWMLFGSQLYVWNYVDSLNPQECTVLDFPPSLLRADTGGCIVGVHWFVRIVTSSRASSSREAPSTKRQSSFAFATTSSSHAEGDMAARESGQESGVPESRTNAPVGVVALHKKTMAVAYWPDITRDNGGPTIIGRVNEEWVSPHGSGRPSGSFGSRARHTDFVTAVIAIGHRTETNAEQIGAVETSSSEIGQASEGARGEMEESEEPSGCILVAGCNSGELWRLDCSTEGVRILKLGREADAPNSRSATFGMLAFGRSTAPATVRGIVVLPDSPVSPLNTVSNISEKPSQGTMWGVQEKVSPEEGGNWQMGYSGFRQKSKQKKQQQQQHVQQQELERQEKQKIQQAAEDMEKGGTSVCRFLLLTAAGLEAWVLQTQPGGKAILAWAYDILGDSAVRMDLAGQKQVWLLDFALPIGADSVTVLVASLCKDLASVNSYHTQYWLLSFILPPKSSLQPLTKPLTQPLQAPGSPPPSPPPSRPSTPSLRRSPSPKSLESNASTSRENPIASAFRLERKMPARIFVIKARVEDEEAMLLLRLTLGGKPKDSAAVLASDGTVTIATFGKGDPLLYQMDPNWPSDRVLGVGYLPIFESREGISTGLETGGRGGLEEMTDGIVSSGTHSEGGVGRTGQEWAVLTVQGVYVLPEMESGLKSMAGGQGSGMAAWSDGQTGRITSVGFEEVARDRDRVMDELVEKLMRVFEARDSAGMRQVAVDAVALGGGWKKNVLVHGSHAIVDSFPKRSASTRDPSMLRHSSAFSVQLGGKMDSHERYLQCLFETGLYKELQSKHRTAMTAVLEDGEKLAAVLSLRESHNNSDQMSLISTLNRASPLWEAVQLAGDNLRKSDVYLSDREPADVFYARVSQVGELFHVIDQHAETTIGRKEILLTAVHKSGAHQPLSVGLQAQRLRQLSDALQSAIQAAEKYKFDHKEWYPNVGEASEEEELSGGQLESWLSSGPLRRGFWRLANLCLEIKGEVMSSEPSLTADLMKNFQEISCRLLDMYAHAVAMEWSDLASIALGAEYRDRAEFLVNEMVDYARQEAYRLAGDTRDDNEARQLRRSELIRMYSLLLPVAKAHHAHKSMLVMCEDLNDWDALMRLMRDSAGGGGSDQFCFYVFQCFYERKLYGFLLFLGNSFEKELEGFLQDKKGLRWLHELTMEAYGQAGNTLIQEATSKDSLWVHWKDEREEGDGAVSKEEKERRTKVAISKRKYLLSMAKLSLRVAHGRGKDREIAEIDAGLMLLDIQEMAARANLVGTEPIAPQQLAEACLEGTPSLQLRAFDVFALGGSEMRDNCKGLLERAWLTVANLDEWTVMKSRCDVEGWPEDYYNETLTKSALYHAGLRCFGKDSFRIGDPFEAVLPLFPGNGSQAGRREAMRGLGDSVLSVLSRHTAYATAGEAMMEALEMGSGIKRWQAEYESENGPDNMDV